MIGAHMRYVSRATKNPLCKLQRLENLRLHLMPLRKAFEGALRAYIGSKYRRKGFDRQVAELRNELKCGKATIQEITTALTDSLEISKGLPVVIIREDIWGKRLGLVVKTHLRSTFDDAVAIGQRRLRNWSRSCCGGCVLSQTSPHPLVWVVLNVSRTYGSTSALHGILSTSVPASQGSEAYFGFLDLS